MSDKYGRYFGVMEVVSVSNKKEKNILSDCESRVRENVKNGKNSEKEM